MIIGKTAIFIRQEHKNIYEVVNHRYSGKILDKFLSHEKIVTEHEGVKLMACDYYMVQLIKPEKLSGVVAKFFPDEMVKLSSIEDNGETYSTKLIQR